MFGGPIVVSCGGENDSSQVKDVTGALKVYTLEV